MQHKINCNVKNTQYKTTKQILPLEHGTLQEILRLQKLQLQNELSPVPSMKQNIVINKHYLKYEIYTGIFVENIRVVLMDVYSQMLHTDKTTEQCVKK